MVFEAKTILTPGSEFLMDQNKSVMNLNNNETEIPEDQLEEYALQLNANDFACRVKGKKQNHKEENLLALHQESFPLKGGLGLTLNQGNNLSPIMKYRRK